MKPTLKELLAKATPRPWRVDTQGQMPFLRAASSTKKDTDVKVCIFPMGWTQDKKDTKEMLECIDYKKSCLALDKDKAGNFTVANIDRMAEATFIVSAYTLPLAIASFAKQLHSK